MKAGLQSRCFASSLLAHGALIAILLLAPGFRQHRLNALGAGPPLNMIPGELVDAALAPGPAPRSAPSDTETPPAIKPTPVPATPPPSEPAPKQPPPKPAPKAASEIKFDLPKADGPGFVLPSSQAPEKDPKKVPEREAPPRIDFSKARPIKPPATRRPERPEPEPARAAAEAADRNRSRMQDLARTIASVSGSLARAGDRGTVRIQVSAGSDGGAGGGGGGGGGSAYAWALRNAYDNAWVAPQGVADDLATTEVEIVIRKDGRVLSGRIRKTSGFASLDRSVQEALRRVTQVPAFEAGATEDQRTYTIGFNMRGKRSI